MADQEITIGGGSSQITLSQAIQLVSLAASLATKIAEAIQAGNDTVDSEAETKTLKELLLRPSEEVIAEADKEAVVTKD